MSFKLTLADRLDYLAHIGPGIEDLFFDYERPFAEGRVVDARGAPVADLPPAVKQAQEAVMQAVHAFEAVAADELQAISTLSNQRRKS